MVRLLPKSEIGIWVLFTSVAAIFEMVRNGFIRNPFVALLVSAEGADKNQVTTASLVLHCILGGLLSIILLLGANPLQSFWDAPGIENLFFLYARVVDGGRFMNL